MSVRLPHIRSSVSKGARTITQSSRAAQAAVAEQHTSIAHEFDQNAAARNSRTSIRPEHGSRIYVFHHLQKNHIVYSLNKVMKNTAALRQLPYNGKKTVPSALRKDLWSPFAMVQFPPGHGEVGLSAFQKLREYRKRHELEWGDEIRYREQTVQEIAAKKKRQREPFSVRGRKICDQKANSVADLAAVLADLDAPKTQVTARRGRRVSGSAVAASETAELQVDGEEEGEQARVSVYWRDLNDAEFAEDWSEEIEHGELSMLDKNGALKQEYEQSLDFAESEETLEESQPAKPKSIWKMFS